MGMKPNRVAREQAIKAIESYLKSGMIFSASNGKVSSLAKTVEYLALSPDDELTELVKREMQKNGMIPQNDALQTYFEPANLTVLPIRPPAKKYKRTIWFEWTI